MQRQTVLVVLAAVALLLLVLVAGRARLGAAAFAEAQARADLQQATSDLAALEGLRSGRIQVGTARRPDADLVEQIQAALTAQGLPLTAFQGVTPREDRVQRGSQVRIQAVQVRFAGLQPSEFGSFLAAWHGGRSTAAGGSRSPWYVAEVQFAHQRTTGTTRSQPARTGRPAATPSSAAANRYAITVLLTAPYVDPTG